LLGQKFIFISHFWKYLVDEEVDGCLKLNFGTGARFATVCFFFTSVG
jgi:hypothetical protein